MLQVYFAKMPHKTHHLRADSLAIMLSLANVGAHAEVIDGAKAGRRVPCSMYACGCGSPPVHIHWQSHRPATTAGELAAQAAAAAIACSDAGCPCWQQHYAAVLCATHETVTPHNMYMRRCWWWRRAAGWSLSATHETIISFTTRAQVLVVEACCGVVTGAVAERLGGHGTVCAAFPGDKPPSYDASRL